MALKQVKIERARPPSGMSAAQKTLWEAVIGSKPAEWWTPDTLPVVAEYVRAADASSKLEVKVGEALRAGDPDDIKHWMTLRDRESRRAVSIATSLRLTQQSQYTPKSAATAARRAGMGGSKPWE